MSEIILCYQSIVNPWQAGIALSAYPLVLNLYLLETGSNIDTAQSLTNKYSSRKCLRTAYGFLQLQSGQEGNIYICRHCLLH